jgi:hypothetical protein
MKKILAGVVALTFVESTVLATMTTAEAQGYGYRAWGYGGGWGYRGWGYGGWGLGRLRLAQ